MGAWKEKGRGRHDRAALPIWRCYIAERNLLPLLPFELEMKFNEIPHGGNWIVWRRMIG